MPVTRSIFKNRAHLPRNFYTRCTYSNIFKSYLKSEKFKTLGFLNHATILVNFLHAPSLNARAGYTLKHSGGGLKEASLTEYGSAIVGTMFVWPICLASETDPYSYSLFTLRMRHRQPRNSQIPHSHWSYKGATYELPFLIGRIHFTRLYS